MYVELLGFHDCCTLENNLFFRIEIICFCKQNNALDSIYRCHGHGLRPTANNATLIC